MLTLRLVPPGTSYVEIPCDKRAAMRILLETVQRGSRFWTGGTVPVGKALAFSEKMGARYAADRNAGQRAYAKQIGRANTALVMYPDDDPTRIRYWLLVTLGEGPVHTLEQLMDAHKPRESVAWGDQYRLHQVQRPRAHSGSRTWTWSMTNDRFTRLLESIRMRAAAPGGPGDDTKALDALVQSIQRMPGHYGIRQQQRALLDEGELVWRRTHRESEVYPWPRRLPYLDKRFPCYHRPVPLRLDVLVRMMERRLAETPDWNVSF